MGRSFLVTLLLVCLFSSCAVNQTKYQRRYNEVWREMIQSQAWKESLKQNNEVADTGLYASTEDEVLLDSETNSYKKNLAFEQTYQTLVSRAYFKIITEAEKLDARITAEYKQIQNHPENFSKKEREEMERKFKAHRAMLSGLRSWNVFSEDRSGDLDYFKKENRGAIQKMMDDNQGSDQMINFLIYKLADLYHVEEASGN
ncbi:hypothetical protein PP182_04570 [Maribacter sp. PR1]|uniref:Lipoprotein n=1 Tax=Maribacter cobaltidurans TaxID=1178778 RepID=A0ABU7IR41_9FLAO|nr:MULTISPECIES: hypothetical protein [Maribacter]MDC6387940.1 hypothetical protein [Maribacter sp. PR1]MEE1975329.1 hypothetical protein [Maribacter cobaltidurans]